MNEIDALAASIGTYGLYTIIAVLCVAVIYLFRKVNELQLKIQDILTADSKVALELTTRVTIALETNSKILERVEKILDK